MASTINEYTIVLNIILAIHVFQVLLTLGAISAQFNIYNSGATRFTLLAFALLTSVFVFVIVSQMIDIVPIQAINAGGHSSWFFEIITGLYVEWAAIILLAIIMLLGLSRGSFTKERLPHCNGNMYF